MKKMISILGAVCALVGSAIAAPELIWSAAEGNGKTLHPYGKWYTYKSGTAAGIDTATTSTAKVITAKASKTAETSAGVGFGWGAKPDTVKDLSAYEGVCLTYTADGEFRMDFKQSTIKDYNYNGVIVPAQSAMETVFFPFSEFKQEDWGDETVTKAFDLTKQTGVQFGFKTANAKESGITTNIIQIAAIAFGSSCVNHAPTLQTGVKPTDEATLKEGDTLMVAFKNIFEDEDGDALNIVMAVDGYVDDLKGAKSYGLNDVAWIKSKPNPTGTHTSATLTFTAKDGDGLSVKYVIDLTLVDRQNAPVAVADTYEMNEDDTLAITTKTKGVLANDIDDDDDDFLVTANTEPTNGNLVMNKNGTFTYTPNANFAGTDEFTYTITDATELESVGKVTIVVKNVDDPATVDIKEAVFYLDDDTEVEFETGLTLNEDFGSIDLSIPVGNIEFKDPDMDGSSLTPKAKNKKGLFEIEMVKMAGSYVISLSSIEDVNGEDAIELYVADGKDTAKVEIPVTIVPVADPPKAFNDTFTVVQDSVNSIPAAKGLLVNDVNPDGKSALKAYLLDDAAKGTVTVDTTGAFTYAATEYEGKDSFTYVIVNAEGEQSKAATVVLNVVYKNKAPAILAGVLDTVGTRVSALKEDFGTTITYKGSEVKSWFEDPEGDALTFSIDNKDSLVAATINSSYAITIKKVPDACGEAFLGVVATDAKGATTTLEIPVNVGCVNDKPQRIGGAIDTIYEPPAGWREAIYVFDIFTDPDDSILVMTTSSVDRILNAVVEGDSLIVTLADETQYLQNHVPYKMQVTAMDAKGAASIAKTLTFMVGDKVGIPQVASAPKAGWQGAIRAEKGIAAIMDVQGRVMWKHRLPVSEDAVRNAAAKVQGRKILQVNKQVWTIK